MREKFLENFIAQGATPNYIASYFQHCTHIVDFSVQETFRYEMSDDPMILSTYLYPGSCLSNYSTQLEIWKDRHMRTWRMKQKFPKIPSLKCILTMISVLDGTVNLNHTGISLRGPLSEDNVIGCATSTSFLILL